MSNELRKTDQIVIHRGGSGGLQKFKISMKELIDYVNSHVATGHSAPNSNRQRNSATANKQSEN